MIRICRALGFSEAIANIIAARLWSLLSGPVSILLISTRLNEVEQGIYYTFGSIMAAKIFLELGLVYVIMQFASYEMVGLKWVGSTLEGNSKNKSRLAALARFSLRWYSTVCILVAIILIPGGLWFFGRNLSENSDVVWRLPWILLVSFSAISVLLSPLIALIEGTGKVAEVSRVRFFEGMTIAISLWTGLLLGGALFASAISGFGSLCVLGSWLYRTKKDFFRDLWKQPHSNTLDWKAEVLPLQWRIAVTWISGYFAYQLFTPALFEAKGPVISGQFGMTLMLMNVISAVSLSWLQTRSPQFGQLVAEGKLGELDKLFGKSFLQSIGVFTLGCLAFSALIVILNIFRLPIAGRMLNLSSASMLMVAMWFNHTVFARSVYFRAFKREPLMFLQLLNGIAVVIVLSLLTARLPLSQLLTVYALGICIPVALVARLIARRTLSSSYATG